MPGTTAPPRLLGTARLVSRAYAGDSLMPVWQSLLERVNRDPGDAAAFYDLATILQTREQHEVALEALKAALASTRTFEVRCGTGEGLTVLVLMTQGDLMANTPIEFLLARSNCRLLLHYVDAETKTLRDVPEHDVAFLAIGESEHARGVLERLDMLLASWHRPLINGNPRRIMALSRDGVSRMLADVPSVLAPPTARISRALLESVSLGRTVIRDLLAGADFPVVVRPTDTHAGKGMARIATAAELRVYLAAQPDTEMFFLSPFVDYAGADGLYRKERIAFIEGEPFASHMAVSEHWMVHYLSAGMMRHAERRAEEAQWMTGFDAGFARRHAVALRAIADRVGLDYFAIDCAELPDGRLLLFEADVAMIVHGMDSERTFPYKVDAMARLFARFEQALASHARPHRVEGNA
jgi:hypothetical protein